MKLHDYAPEVAPYLDTAETANRYRKGTTIWISPENSQKLQRLSKRMVACGSPSGTKHRKSAAHTLAALIAYLEDFDE